MIDMGILHFCADSRRTRLDTQLHGFFIFFIFLFNWSILRGRKIDKTEKRPARWVREKNVKISFLAEFWRFSENFSSWIGWRKKCALRHDIFVFETTKLSFFFADFLSVTILRIRRDTKDFCCSDRPEQIRAIQLYNFRSLFTLARPTSGS